MKWYKDDEPAFQPMVVALPSEVQLVLETAEKVALRRRLKEEIDAAFAVFANDLAREEYGG